MKIYILRHEDRTIDCSFFGPLTKKGLINSGKLIDKLEKLNIDEIYCSPFIRTMQTIYPFVEKKKLKIKLEYGLIEIKHQDIVPPKSQNVELPLYMAENFNYDKSYLTLIPTNDIKYPETDSDLEIRTKKFLKFIINKFNKTDKTILLVTHQGICKNILKIISKANNKIYNNEIDFGSLSLIFDDVNWIYEKV